MSIWNDIRNEFLKGNAVTRLIMINVVVYITIHLIYVPIFLIFKENQYYYDFIAEWFYVPSNPMKLLTRPWTLFTYMFLHAGVWHIFFNMLLLYWFGRIANNLIASNKIVPIYLLGGLTGALLFIFSFNVFPVFDSFDPNLVGASASVMAIVLAAATLNPRGNIRLFLVGTVELQYVALFMVIIDILSIPATNPGGHFAHLGGAFMGWLFIHQLRRGRDFAEPIHRIGEWIKVPFGGRSPQPRKKRQPKMVYKKAHQASANETTTAANSYGTFSRSFAQRYRNMTHEECVDAILDKIHLQGYESLSEEEKEFLDKMSKDK